MSVATGLRVTPPLSFARRSSRLVERNARLYARTWVVLVSGFFEPLFYLLSIGLGLGHLVGPVRVGAHPVRYAAFVAPALLAASAMNGAVLDCTFNVYHKLKFAKLYDAVLATPLEVGDIAVGEVTWATIRGGLYAATFLVVMAALGLVGSWWTVLALPVALLLGLAFAAAGLAGATYLRSWQDFQFVLLAVLPMFLFSATFYPLATYPGGLRLVVAATPLYQGVAVLRALSVGPPGWADLGHLAYLAALAAGGLWLARRRLARLLLH